MIRTCRRGGHQGGQGTKRRGAGLPHIFVVPVAGSVDTADRGLWEPCAWVWIPAPTFLGYCSFGQGTGFCFLRDSALNLWNEDAAARLSGLG